MILKKQIQDDQRTLEAFGSNPGLLSSNNKKKNQNQIPQKDFEVNYGLVNGLLSSVGKTMAKNGAKNAKKVRVGRSEVKSDRGNKENFVGVISSGLKRGGLGGVGEIWIEEAGVGMSPLVKNVKMLGLVFESFARKNTGGGGEYHQKLNNLK
jgi:hypothetical protein